MSASRFVSTDFSSTTVAAIDLAVLSISKIRWVSAVPPFPQLCEFQKHIMGIHR